jgi:Flp pilus assembly protein TadD
MKASLETAQKHFSAGDLPAARRACQEVLRQSPDHVEALHLVGVIEIQSGNAAAAVEPLRRAVQLDATRASAWNHLGVALASMGRFDEATAAFRRALELDGTLADAHYNLALAQRQLGRGDEALASLKRAVELRPDFAEAQFNLANEYIERAMLDRAVASLQQAIASRPSYDKARRNLAKVYLRLAKSATDSGDHPRAAGFCQQALAAWPDSDAAFAQLGCALAAQSRHPDAVTAFSKAIALRADFAEALVNLGVSLAALGKQTEAEEAYRKALAILPDFAEAHCNLGALLVAKQRHEEAVAHCRKAVSLQGESAEAHMNLGAALAAAGQPVAARESYRQSLRLRPADAETLGNLGLLEHAEGNLEAALEHLDAAVRLRPDDARARSARAMIWLSQGDFARGWPEYEWRFRCKDFGGPPPALPRWQGEPLAGKTILLWAEQGLGDTLQFVRYAALLKERGARAVVECPQPLAPILKSCPAIDHVFAQGTPRPSLDVYAPTMSVPGIVGTTMETISAPIPYLHADEKLVERWGRFLDAGERRRLRVGICWRGQPKNLVDRRRSFSLRELAPLASMPEVELISLQKHAGADEAADFGREFSVRELPRLDEESGPFMDTAAVLCHLDLLISCDSAVAHLAGAMGVAVWLALPAAADWRWFLQRSDSPWYPRHRLFRQSRPGDWASVFAEMERELRKLVAEKVRR